MLLCLLFHCSVAVHLESILRIHPGWDTGLCQATSPRQERFNVSNLSTGMFSESERKQGTLEEICMEDGKNMKRNSTGPTNNPGALKVHYVVFSGI